MLNNRISIFLVLTLIVLTSTCTLWGIMDDPADPNAASYQGYETVSETSEVKPSVDDYGQVRFAPALIANKVAGAEAYGFQIATTSDFSAPLHTSAESTSNIYYPIDWAEFSSSLDYNWRVRAKKGGIWGPWSSPCSFIIAVPEFGTISPVNGATIATLTPTFTWNTISGATGYWIQVSTDTTFSTWLSSSITDDSLNASTYTQTSSLMDSTTYYWRIAAKDTNDLWSALSATFSFQVAIPQITILAIPGVTPPVRGAIPVTSAIDTAQYTGTITWYNLDTLEVWTGPFEVGTEYMAYIILTAKVGWTLSGVGDNYTVAGANFTDANLNQVQAFFPRTGYYSIGETGPGGGKVFYDAGFNQSWGRYLEAAPKTWNGGTSDPNLNWKTTNTTTAGTSTAIGNGYANTFTYLAGAIHPAAALCRACTFGGKNDWFLPSKDELHQMYLQRAIIGDVQSTYYWSSSEYSSSIGWCQDLFNGFLGNTLTKSTNLLIRPVRAF